MNLRALPCVLLPALLGCGDPSLDVKIAAHGGEVAGVPPSALHRPGQACIDCHGPYKGATPQMVLAGSIFAIPEGKNVPPVPVAGAMVTVTDALGRVNGTEGKTPPPKPTNCAGNFYFTTDELQVAFPYGVTIECPEPTDATKTHATRSMVTRVSREGSCNACHHDDKTQSSPGWIVCDDDPGHTGQTVYPPVTPQSCPGAVPASMTGGTGTGP